MNKTINNVVPANLQKWSLSDSTPTEAPVFWEETFANMFGTSILAKIVRDYKMQGNKTAEFKLNVLSTVQDYYDTTAAYGQADWMGLALDNSQKVGENEPAWDSYNDYRWVNYVREKYAEWGRTIAIIREEKFWNMVLAKPGTKTSTFPVDPNPALIDGEALLENLYLEALTLTKTIDKYHNRIPKNMIIVIVNTYTGNAIRKYFTATPQNPDLLKTGVLPIGERNQILFYESEIMEPDKLNYVIAVKTAWGAAFNPGQAFTTPIGTTRDFYFGTDFQTGQDIFQPNLVILNKPTAPLNTVSYIINGDEETNENENIDVTTQETTADKTGKTNKKNTPKTDVTTQEATV